MGEIMDEMNAGKINREIVETEAKKLGLDVVEPKQWWKSKTLLANMIVVAIAFLGWLAGPEFPLELGEYSQYVAFALAVLNIVLRLVTGQPIATARHGK